MKLSSLIAVGACALLLPGCQQPSAPRIGGTSPSAEVVQREPRPDSPGEAMEFRYRQRLSEDGRIPPNALLRAHQDVQGMRAGERDGGINSLSWTEIGPLNVGGRLRGLLIHPTTPTTLWVGSVSGGIWKSTDGGLNWALLDGFLPSLNVGCMTMDPANPDIMYVGTGEGFFNSDSLPGAGIFKTIDGGASWSQIPSTIPINPNPTSDIWGYVNRIAISPTDSMIMLAATNGGILRSINGGGSWTNVLGIRTLDLDFHPTDGMKAIAGTNGNAYYSVDAGATWTAATGFAAGAARVEVAYARSAPTIVYAGVEVNSGRLYRSSDGGATYAQTSATSYMGTQGWYDNALWVDPVDSTRVVVGGIDLYRSINSGTTLTKISNWQQVPISAHADHHVIVHHPGYDGVTNKIVYFGNDGGVYKATDVLTVTQTSGWTFLNNTLGVTQFYGGAINSDGSVVIGGTQDNGTLRSDGPTDWTRMFGGDGGACSADRLRPGYMFGEYVYVRIHRSSNAGISSGYIYTGGANPLTDAVNSTANFIAPFVLDPNNGHRLLAGGASLWRTNNARAINPDWFVIKSSIGSNVSAITIQEGNSDVAWVGHNNGNVYKSTNATAASPTWTRVDLGTPFLPNRFVNGIAIDRANANRVFVAFSGYNADNLWRTLDGGTNWTKVVGPGSPGDPATLPRSPINTVVMHPTLSTWLYVGTDSGVFASTDSGANWSSQNDGPNNVEVDQLMWRAGNKLVAVTHGRGMFEATLDLSTLDCDNNSQSDSSQLNVTTDCNGNALLDACEISANASLDCNSNGILDACEAGYGDCDGNEVLDFCELAGRDCNSNGRLDSCEFAPGIVAEDACASARRIAAGVIYSGSNAGATNDGGDSCNLAGATPPDVWYKYVPASNGSATISLCGTLYDAILSVHSGCPGTTSNEISCNDDSGCGSAAANGGELTLAVIIGTEYYIRVTGYANPPGNGDTGTFYLKVTGPTAIVDDDCNGNAVLDACDPPGATDPIVSVQPEDASVCVGANATLSVSAIGMPALSYQWRRGLTPLADGGGISGSQSPTLGISPVAPGDVGSDYNCVITNSCGQAVTLDAAIIAVPSGGGDGDLSGQTDGLDAQGLVDALLGGPPAIATFCVYDMDLDGDVDFDDVPLFIAALVP